MHNPSPTQVRRDTPGVYRPSDEQILTPGREAYLRQSQDALNDKARNLEKLNQQIAYMENKNKQLLDTLSRNEKKVQDLLRSTKEDSQSLLTNLKKLLVKQVINAEALQGNPASQKFIAKLKESKPSFAIGMPSKSTNGTSIFNQSDTENKGNEHEVNFILQELKKNNDGRRWVSALSYSKLASGGTSNGI